MTSSVRACVRVYVRVYVRACVRVYVRVYVRECVRVYVCVCVVVKHAPCVHVYERFASPLLSLFTNVGNSPLNRG